MKKISLSCENCNTKNYYIKSSGEMRLKIKKYCKKCNQHTLHKGDK